MNTHSFVHPLLVVALVSGLAPGLSARDEKKPAPLNQRPAVRVDASPIADARPGVVLSYADVVEPVQKAVVSIY